MTLFRFDWVEKYLGRKPHTIFDVGAWDAADSISFKERFPEATVIAFEACPDNFAAIKKSGKAAASGVRVFNFAVLDRNGPINFHSNEDAHQGPNPGMSGSILAPTEKLKTEAPHLRFKEPRKVLGVRLDAFCQTYHIPPPDVLHVDVQGAEPLVLEGLGVLRPGLIFLETDETEDVGHYRGAKPLTELWRLLWDLGYLVAYDSGHDALWVHKAYYATFRETSGAVAASP